MRSQLQNKLLEYAPAPPEKVWDAIEGALDGSASTLSHKLYSFEVDPPIQVWDKINSDLNKTGRPAKIITLYQQHRNAFRYSAAAILLFVIITSGFLISRETAPQGLATIPEKPRIQQDKADPGALPQADPSQNMSLYQPDKGYKDDKPADLSEERKTLLNRLQPQLKLGSLVLITHFLPKVALTKQTVSEDSQAEKYMIYSDGDGNALRLPKKLFDFFSCAKEEQACQQQMQQLQKQFASTSLATDFTSLVEMLQKLKENQ